MKNSYLGTSFLLAVCLLLVSCKNKDKTNISIQEYDTLEVRKKLISKNQSTRQINQITCFTEDDEKIIYQLLENIQLLCESGETLKDYLSNSYISEFESFPCSFYQESLKFNAKPKFKIIPQDDNCDSLVVSYNYWYTIIEEEEEYSSEKTFTLYLIKLSNNEILIDSFGISG
jgi:hypothetical protein